MATALDYISRSLRLLAIIAPGENPDAAEAQDGLMAFNAMINAMALDGLDLGRAEYALTDEVYVPLGYEKALAYAFALELAPEYGLQPPPLVMSGAIEMKNLIRAHQVDIDALYPDRMLTWGNRWTGPLI